VVLSPHLDDAVLSIGAFLHREARNGARVRVVTVLANDPAADLPGGSWDVASGFPSAAAAARARREEDRRACSVVGAEPHWLSYGDETYGRSVADDEIWDALLNAIGDCELALAPGFPLRHADHAWLARLVVARRGELTCALGFYGEQPYASAAPARGRPATPPLPLTFERVATRPNDVYAKLRACLQYRSQLRGLGVRVLLRAFLEERLRHGELLALPPPAPR
jgi:LmbE family N-acetylglucosaminyl deacetylase